MTFIKNFLEWFELKPKIHERKNPPSFKDREVWWSYLGENIGSEQNGKNETFARPVIVLKKFNKNMCLVVPTSTKLKENPYYVQVKYAQNTYSALISQIRVIDANRLKDRIATLDFDEFQKIKKAIVGYLI